MADNDNENENVDEIDPNDELEKEHQKEILELKKQQAEVDKKLDELAQKRLQAGKELSDQLKGSIKQYTGITDQSTSILGKMTRMIGEAKSLEDRFKRIGLAGKEIFNTLKEAFSIGNILGSLIDNIIESTINVIKQTQEMTKQFEKSVGNISTFSRELGMAQGAVLGMRLASGEAIAVVKDLVTQFGAFANLTRENRDILVRTNMSLVQLGVSSSDLAKTQNFLHKSLQMTAKEAATLEKQMYATGIQMGLSPQKMLADFANIAPKLAVHGKQMVDVFLNLQEQAKNTGLSMEKLLGISEQFDTFQKASENVGQLNAVLGGDFLDAQKIMMMNESERVKYLKEQLALSGQNFNTMDRWKQAEIARLTGMKDVASLQALMNNETGKTAPKLTEQEKAQQMMNKALGNTVTLTDRIQALWNRLGTIFGPVANLIVGVIGEILGVFNEWITAFTNLMKTNDTAAIKLKDIWKGFGSFFSGIWTTFLKPIVDGFLGLFGTSSDSLTASMKNGFKDLPDIVEKAKNSIKSSLADLRKEFPLIDRIMKFFEDANEKFSKLSTGEKIGGAAGFASVLGVLFGLFSDDTSDDIDGVTDSMGESGKKTGLSGALDSVKEAITSFGENFMMIGAGIAGIGIGIGVAAIGVSKLVDSLAGLSDEQMKLITNNLKLLKDEMMGPAGVTVGLAGLGAVLSDQKTAINFGIFGAAALGFGAAIALSAWGIGTLIEKLGTLSGNNAALTNFKTILTDLSAAYKSIAEESSITKGVGMAAGLGGLAFALAALANINVKEVISLINVFANANEGIFNFFGNSFKNLMEKNLLPNLRLFRGELFEANKLVKETNETLLDFNEKLKNIEGMQLKTLAGIRAEFQIIASLKSSIIEVGNALKQFTDLSVIPEGKRGFADMVTEINNALVALANNPLANDTLDKITQMGAEQAAALAGASGKQVTLLKLEEGSDLEKIGKAIVQGKAINIQIDGRDIAIALTTGPGLDQLKATIGQMK